MRACRRLLRQNGAIAYATIVTSSGLDRKHHREALRLGPPAVEARAPDDVLMQKAGFVDVQITDVTSEFLDTARSWRGEFSRHESAVKAVVGEAEWEERQASRAGIIKGIEDGLLRRTLVSGLWVPKTRRGFD
ncbi:MAG: hypothetical protein LC749_03165 [Actinobacteria bacterium]|nr:hypothetical protein [Actinomycetota bacterium]